MERLIKKVHQKIGRFATRFLKILNIHTFQVLFSVNNSPKNLQIDKWVLLIYKSFSKLCKPISSVLLFVSEYDGKLPEKWITSRIL